MTTSPAELWLQVREAGGLRAYVDKQLRERGFLVERRDADSLSDRERERYKKELKAESAERKKLARDAWAAYKTAHIVHLGETIFWSESGAPDKWDTPNSEERAAENELPPLDSPQQLADALGITIGQLRGMCYHREAATSLHYRRFTIPKRDGSARAIWAPLPRLKKAQRWVLTNIAERLPVHGAAHGFLAGRSTLTNASQHPDSRVVLKLDVKDFFPTVTWRRVKGVFRRAGYRERVATLLALLCTEAPREIVELGGTTYYVALGERCLPQGAPTSPAITNALCLRLDRRLSGLAAKAGWRYTRYADDLTFSRASSLERSSPDALADSVAKIVVAEGFAIKPEKTRYARPGGRQTVTGLVVNGELTPRAPRVMKRKLRAAIHTAKLGKPLPEGESLARMQGFAAYIFMTEAKLGARYLAEVAALQTPIPA